MSPFFSIDGWSRSQRFSRSSSSTVSPLWAFQLQFTIGRTARRRMACERTKGDCQATLTRRPQSRQQASMFRSHANAPALHPGQSMSHRARLM